MKTKERIVLLSYYLSKASHSHIFETNEKFIKQKFAYLLVNFLRCSLSWITSNEIYDFSTKSIFFKVTTYERFKIQLSLYLFLYTNLTTKLLPLTFYNYFFRKLTLHKAHALLS